MKLFRSAPLRRYLLQDLQLGTIDRLFFKEPRERSELNRHMFNEDFSRVFNHSNDRENLSFDVNSNDFELLDRILFEDGRTATPYSRDQSLMALVDEIAQSLTQLGRAYYFADPNEDTGTIDLERIYDEGLINLFGSHIQWVPRRKLRRWDRPDEILEREIRVLNSKKVLRFSLPTPLRKVLSAQNRILSAIDRQQYSVTKFHPETSHENPNPKNDFDFTVWRSTQDLAFYKGTRGTGWNGRKYDPDLRSDFFDCHRLIRFRRNQVLLRDGIVRQLTTGLKKAGRMQNRKFDITIAPGEAIVQLHELNGLDAKLAREEISFTEIVEFCYAK